MNVKQTLPSCLLAMSLLPGVAAAAAAPTAPSFLRTGTLRSCLDPSFAPMEFYAQAGDAQPVGVDVDLTRALSQLWGVQMQLMPVEFTGMLPALQAGRCDAVISAVLLKPERAKVLATVPYLATYVVIVGRADSRLQVANELDLAGLTIAVESGTSYAHLLEQINQKIIAAGRKPILIQTYPKDSDAIQQLLVGRAAGVVSQDTEVAHRNAQGMQFKMLFRLPVRDEYAIYLRPNAADQASVAAAIAQLKANGTLKQIVERWHLPLHTLETDAHQP
jgi:polar amino acid transport system substrate-binding protein